MIDTTQPGSPGWWLRRLLTKLAARQDRFAMLESYANNTQVIPVHATKATSQAYQRLMAISRTNFAELVVEAVRERMMPLGFRTGAEGDINGDNEAWRIWQANSLDADHALVTRTALVTSTAFMIVGGVDSDIGAPLITPESPHEVAVDTDPRRRRKVRAALKLYRDDVLSEDRAVLYLPGKVLYAGRRAAVGAVVSDMTGMEWTGESDLPFPVVPVVPFFNRPDMSGSPMGEFEPHLTILDRINYTLLSRVEIATLQAFRQRAVSDVPLTDDQGNRINYDDVFSMDPGAMWILPGAAKMWESGQVDLNPIRQSIRDDVQDLAAVTRTPLFYLTPEATNGSAAGASLSREGLAFKTTDRIRQESESLEQVMSLAFLFAGDTVRSRRGDMEVIWAPPERFSLAERYDAAAKAQAAGVPWRTVMADVLQFSPQQIERMEAERVTDALLLPQFDPDEQ